MAFSNRLLLVATEMHKADVILPILPFIFKYVVIVLIIGNLSVVNSL